MARMTTSPHAKPIKKRLAKKKKLALVLAGGGITGVTYQIGALQALNRFFDGDFSVTDFDILIGLSAGAFIGSLLANGIEPAEMFAALDEQSRSVETLNQLDIFYPNFSEVVARPLAFPYRLVRSGIGDLLSGQQVDPYGYVESLNEVLPSGLFSNKRIEAYLRKNLSQPGRTNDFRKLKKEFYVAATDLDTGERVMFGGARHRDTPISRAVQASTALPIFYKPVEINGREYVDGSIRKSLHIDVALKRGADLVMCINPLVPLQHDLSRRSIPLLGGKGRYLSQKGLVFVAHQVMRIMVHSRIRSGLEKYRERYPQADILLIEPRPDDEQMFFYQLMKYSDRLSIARHGYEETLETLLKRFSHFQQRLQKHRINVSQQRTKLELDRIRRLPANSYDEIQHLLYAPPESLKTIDRLRAALDTLEQQLTQRRA